MNYNPLKNKRIINLLIGDESLYGYSGLSTYGMPKISSLEICELAKKYGLIINYDSEKIPRWKCYEKLLDYIIENNIVNEFFTYIFSRNNFRKVLSNCDDIIELENYYNNSFYSIIQRINTCLYIDGYELSICNDNKVIYKKIGEDIIVEFDNVDKINNEYVIKLHCDALAELNNCNYDSVITKSRTMMEEILIELIKDKNINPNDNGNIIELYKQYKALYNFNIDKKTDMCLKKLLGGLETIVQSVSEMRNNYSDSHGSSNRIMADRQHAILVLNSALTFCEYIINVSK